eukprot:SAG31_NODE_35374_length_323_cov_1.995536_1_plen_25_part_10
MYAVLEYRYAGSAMHTRMVPPLLPV